jgi:hypothetical protein
MRCADEAMYAAKEKGKNSFQVYPPKLTSAGGDGGNSLLNTSRVPLPDRGA